eukprot:1817134-Rhodomonas_salina.3
MRSTVDCTDQATNTVRPPPRICFSLPHTATTSPSKSWQHRACRQHSRAVAFRTLQVPRAHALISEDHTPTLCWYCRTMQLHPYSPHPTL